MVASQAGQVMGASRHGRHVQHGTGCAFMHSTPVRYELHPKQRAEGEKAAPGVDLRAKCPPIYNQGALNACTAYAVCKGLGEFMAARRGTPLALSARTLYYMSRTPEFVTPDYQSQFRPDTDSGSTTSWAMAAMSKYGAPPEATFPDVDPAKTHLPTGGADKAYCQAFAALAPSAEMLAAGQPNRLASSYQSGGDLEGKQLVTLVFGMLVYDGFYRDELEEGKGGDVRPPVAGEAFRTGHAVLAVGYDNARQMLIVRNSFGEKWGAQGYFYLSFDYFKGYDHTVDNALVYDAWSVKP
jgi:hypothetical protein